MTDFGAEEIVAAPAKKRRKFWTSDRIIGYSGAALALMAAFFPWYVFFNSAKFGINATVTFFSRNFPGWEERKTFSQSPSAIINERLARSANGTQDPLTTGTVPGLDDVHPKIDPSAVDQPFPAQVNDFHLLHVSNGKALIEDNSGVYLVAPGSPLPDLSKVANLEERNGQWVLVTDKGDIYGSDGKQP
jgi:hypothetical protein